ncbi:hypothetical protein [Streptomyces sp. NPDC055189]
MRAAGRSHSCNGTRASTSWTRFALRVGAGDRSLVHSGDTAPCANLTTLAGTPEQAVARAAARFEGSVVHAAPGAVFPIG